MSWPTRVQKGHGREEGNYQTRGRCVKVEKNVTTKTAATSPVLAEL